MRHLLYNRLCATLAVCGLIFSGCSKLIEVDPPSNQLISSEVFKDSTTALAALNGIYNRMEINLYTSYINQVGMYTDELVSTSQGPITESYMFSVIPVSDNGNLSIWSNLYSVVYQCNDILERTEASTFSSETKLKLAGEPCFLRAFAYFNLLNIYGNIPLILTTNVNDNKQKLQDDSLAVTNQIISDLKQAKASLKTSYVTGSRIRANKWAASALLARVYLYQRQWLLAEQEASDVINSGLYTPLVRLSDVFPGNSNEAILQFQSQNGSVLGAGGLLPSDPATPPSYQVTENLYKSFENGDERKTQWIGIGSDGSTGAPFYYQTKYKNGATGGSVPENLMVMRIAEQYLIRAEARNEQEKVLGPNGAEADLNIVRNRAGLIATTAADKLAMRLAIEHERRSELFIEWGHRFFDLKRTGRIDAIIGAYKPTWKKTSARWPIPFSELSANRNLIQNSGY